MWQTNQQLPNLQKFFTVKVYTAQLESHNKVNKSALRFWFLFLFKKIPGGMLSVLCTFQSQ